jgi:hypothetical protein
MIAIDTRQLHAMEWRQPSAFNRNFELKTGDSQLASLKFLKTFGSLAEGCVLGEAWTFKRSGFLAPKASARVAGNEEDIITYEPNFTGTKGMMRMHNGEMLELKATNFWGSEWSLLNMRGEVFLQFHLKGMIRHGSSVAVQPAALDRKDLPLLLLFSWYIIVLHQQDSAAGASA